MECVKFYAHRHRISSESVKYECMFLVVIIAGVGRPFGIVESATFDMTHAV